MSEILQEIFIVENKAELVLPMILITILVSFGQFFIHFIRLGQGCGNPQQRMIAIGHIRFHFLIFIESIIAILLYLFKIEEILIGKIFLITLIATIILNPIIWNVIDFIVDFIGDITWKIECRKWRKGNE